MQTADSVPPLPHLPVELHLSKSPRAYREKVLKRVKQFPLTTPMGPARKPPNCCTQEVLEGKWGQERLDTLHRFMVQGMEEELTAMYDIDEEEKDAYKGRAEKPEFVWRQAGGAPCGKHPASDRKGRHWRLLQRRFEDVEHAINKGRFEAIDNSLKALTQDVKKGGKVLGYNGKEESRMVNLWRSWIISGCASWVQWEARTRATKCEQQAGTIEKEAAKARAKTFREWAQEATRNGGGAAHRYTKILAGWKAAVVPGGDHPGGKGQGLATNPQKVVDTELTEWQATWGATPEPAGELPPWPIVQRMMPILEEETRKTLKTYKWRTGLGLDQLHPRHLGLCSDECIWTWGYFFYLCEAVGKWSGAMECYSFFLSLKANGNFRTIGLLPMIYRIWAKLRMPLVRDWGASVPRAFFAAGVGKSTEDSIGRVLMQGEAISTAEEAAVIIADIDKCYENVDHAKLRRAAIQHKFPLAILRLCLRMYRAARTVCWDGVFGNFVYAGQSLVPGCSIYSSW